jgi:hypothetical protein
VKYVLAIVGLAIAAAGGVIAYRAWFLEPSAAVVITNTDVHELPNYTKIVGGVLLLIIGAAITFLSIRPRK